MAFVVNGKIDGRKPNDVYIGRGTKWGNPFKIGKDGTREQVIEKYENHLSNLIRIGEITTFELAQLQFKRLVCHCKPLPCHGDVLVKAVEWAYMMEEK